MRVKWAKTRQPRNRFRWRTPLYIAAPYSPAHNQFILKLDSNTIHPNIIKSVSTLEIPQIDINVEPVAGHIKRFINRNPIYSSICVYVCIKPFAYSLHMNAFSHRTVTTMELNLFLFFVAWFSSCSSARIQIQLRLAEMLDINRKATTLDSIYIAEYANQVCVYRDKWRLRYSMERWI